MRPSGVCGGVSHYLMAAGFARTPASTLAPFAYIQLIWETLAGYLVFGDAPDRTTIVGALVIVGTGVYLLLFERARRLAS